MCRDPIIQTIRKARDAHARKFNYNLKDICADLKKLEAESGHPIIRKNPRHRDAGNNS